jgi:hypothetical protein
MPSVFLKKSPIRSAASRESRFHTRVHGILTLELLAWRNARDRSQLEQPFTKHYPTGREDLFQIDLLDVLYGVMSDDFEAIHVPNGGKRDPRTGAYLKRLGTRAGVYDLVCGWTGGEGWLELKAGDNKTNFAQKQFGAWLGRTNKSGSVVRSIVQALWVLVLWGAPLSPEFGPLAALGRPVGVGQGGPMNTKAVSQP